MPQTVNVELGERSYNIIIDENFCRLGEEVVKVIKPAKITVISDSNIAPLYMDEVKKQFEDLSIETHSYIFKAGEESKSLSQLEEIYNFLFSVKADRKSALVALGGGVTGDLAGYAAASYMRGIPFIQVPTSILAMVDSSIGGKTAVNHPKGKNTIGAFHQPSLVYANLSTLKTLPKEEFACGMAEVIKHGIIKEPCYFSFVRQKTTEIKTLEYQTLSRVVEGSCKIKSAVVSEDERESGVRAILNFGHTLAHALESLTNYKGYRHGEAVGVGMVAACYLGEELLSFDNEDTKKIIETIQSYNLPATFSKFSNEEIIESMMGDKKTEYGTIRFVVPKKIGKVEILAVDNLSAIKNAIDRCRA
jgi:3-dehydroquinate synthase